MLRLKRLAPIPVMTLPARSIPKSLDVNDIKEPAQKTINPPIKPCLRPNTSERGPQIKTDRPAQNEYPENRNPITVEDFPNWLWMAGSSGLKT